MITPTMLQYMDCGTIHITREDNDLLERCAKSNAPGTNLPVDGPLIIYSYLHGFFVSVPEELEDRKAQIIEHGYSEALYGLLEIAQKHKAVFLRLDSDGEQYDELPNFDW